MTTLLRLSFLALLLLAAAVRVASSKRPRRWPDFSHDAVL